MIELEVQAGRVDHGGEAIYWEVASTGPDDTRPVVVLSHGAGGSHAVWYQQVPVLGQTFRVLTWDSRGFGNSTNNNRAPSAEAAGADLAAVLDHLGVVDVHLVGQSMGGWHNSAFAQRCPHRVLSLVFADTVGGLWTPELRSAFAAFMQSRRLASSGPQRLGVHPALWTGTRRRDPAQAFLYQALGSFHDPPMEKLGTTLDWSVDHATIDALAVPVLFVAGAHDDLFPPDLLADTCSRLANGRYVEIPDAGHSPYFEQPTAWNDAVSDFLVHI